MKSTDPFGPLGFAELPKRPPYRGRSAELLLRSIKSTDRKRVSGESFVRESRCFHPEIRISGWKRIRNLEFYIR
jgi:hypothetical protein